MTADFYCSKCGEARDSEYTCRDGGTSVSASAAAGEGHAREDRTREAHVHQLEKEINRLNVRLGHAREGLSLGEATEKVAAAFEVVPHFPNDSARRGAARLAVMTLGGWLASPAPEGDE